VKTESGARLINTVSERCKKARAHWDELTGMKVVNSELIIREIVSEKRVTFAELTQMVRDGEIDLEDLVRNVALARARKLQERGRQL